LISVSELPVEAEVEVPVTTIPAPNASSTLSAPAPVAPPTLPDTPPTVSGDVPRGTPIATPGEIPIADVRPNPHQPRRHFNDVSLAELAASVKSNGLIQPIIVRQIDGGYELVAGERRWRAAKLAGMTSIPAIVRELDSFSQAQMALVENIHREDLNPMERAAAYRSLIGQLGLTQGELASRLGEDRSTVANFLRLLDLAEPVRSLIRDGHLSLGHAKVLAGVADTLEQERLGKLVVSQGLSVRNLEKLVQSPSVTPPKAGKPATSAHVADLEKSFTRQLGMRVQIRSGANKSKGRIVIHYGSLDQFDQLSERLGIRTDNE
jgi:ParB family chromosome partitioning protein